MSVVRVVGVAVLGGVDGRPRLLAARRADLDEVRGLAAPGGWELPGGKCEPGEDLAAAAVREVREELGCEVRVLEQLDRVQEIRPGLTLEVVVAEVLTGEPRPLEHAELRWLAAGDLGSVEWLAPDLPFLADLLPWLIGRLGEAT